MNPLTKEWFAKGFNALSEEELQGRMQTQDPQGHPEDTAMMLYTAAVDGHNALKKQNRTRQLARTYETAYLGGSILAVAVVSKDTERTPKGSWRAYIGKVDNDWRDDDVIYLMEHGDKVEYSAACHLFPQWAPKYTWRETDG